MSASGPRATVLVIEDDPQIARFLATALDAHGYALHVAANGHDGLREAALRQPDIVIVDLGLPDISGLDVIGHPERRRHMHTPRRGEVAARPDVHCV